jgi:hypothetical protein
VIDLVLDKDEVTGAEVRRVGLAGAGDVHNAWAAWMLARDPEHRSIRPFEELDAETQAADLPFVEAIRSAASGSTGDPSV